MMIKKILMILSALFLLICMFSGAVSATVTTMDEYITIDNIEDQYKGAKFNVSGLTNVEAGKIVTIDVVSTKFQNEPKQTISPTSYIRTTAGVIAGSNGVNNYSAIINGIQLVADKYTAIVSINGDDGNVIEASNTFNIKSKSYGNLFITATAASNTIAKGDKIKITGHVEGTPDLLLYYIFGSNFFDYNLIIPEDDGTYLKEIATDGLTTGQYFVVIQHPMYDNLFNIIPGNYDAQNSYLVGDTTTSSPFSMNGKKNDIYSFATIADGRLVYRDYISDITTHQTANKAEAVCNLINDGYVDDVYTKLDFVIANSYITANTIKDQQNGEPLKVSGTTNKAVNTDVVIEIISSKYVEKDKSSIPSSSYLVQTCKVVEGFNGVNTYSATFDITPLAVYDEYTAISTIQVIL